MGQGHPRGEHPADLSMRVAASRACACIGVLLILLAVLQRDRAYAAPALFVGIAFLAVSHVLTPCEDQITRWWRHRISR